MSTPVITRLTISFTTFAQTRSLRNVYDTVVACDVIDGTRKRDMLSALRCVGKAIGKELDAIPAEPAQLGRLMADFAPAAVDLSPGRWSNARSLTSKALALTEPLLPLRQDGPASDDWEALVCQLEPKYLRYAILPGLKALSARGIEPIFVTEADLLAYLEQVKQSLKQRPGETCRRFINGWNAGRASVPGWPDIPLAWENRRSARTLPWEAFPSSFKDDVEAWLSRQACDDIFAEDAPPKPLKPITIAHHRNIALLCASALSGRGVATDSIKLLADLVTKTAFREILRAEAAYGTAKSTIARRADFLIGMARHYVKLDPRDLDEFRKIASRAKPETTGMTQKNRGRLQQFPDLDAMRPLLELPFRIQRRLDRKPGSPVRDAERAEAAIAIALLLVAPIRLKNLRSIEIGRNLVRRNGVALLAFTADEVKNEVAIQMTIPAATADLIEWYLIKHRRHRPGNGSTFLFAGKDGGPRSDAGLRAPIEKLLKRELGLTMNPHLFRHFAALLFLSLNPGQFEIVRQFLGHKSLATTMKHYASFDTKAAATTYQNAVEQVRMGGLN